MHISKINESGNKNIQNNITCSRDVFGFRFGLRFGFRFGFGLLRLLVISFGTIRVRAQLVQQGVQDLLPLGKGLQPEDEKAIDRIRGSCVHIWGEHPG